MSIIKKITRYLAFFALALAGMILLILAIFLAYSTITDYKFVEGRLIINFSNGSVYEYISVPKATYVKMVNADSPGRFAKRHILNAFTWRKTINQD